MLPDPIVPLQTAAKAPVDDLLMNSIREDLDDLDTRVGVIKSFDYQFKVNGNLNYLRGTPGDGGVGTGRRLDGALIAAAQTFTKCRLYLEEPGASGNLVVDIRKYNTQNIPILSQRRVYSDTINSIARAGSTLATQSITRSTGSLSTHSITFWKTKLNIQSIILLGNDLARVNVDVAPDSDYLIGDDVLIESATTGANNGVFTISRVNDDGFPCLIIQNPAAVAQLAATGTIVLTAFAYNLNAPAPSDFAVGESELFAGHTSALDDGTFEIYARNSGGNNLVVKNSVGTEQPGVAGTISVQRFVYTFLTPAPVDYVVGENAAMSGHTSGLNNGNLKIVDVNRGGGNNVIVTNSVGVLQGGVAGSVDTNRWVFLLPSDPVTSFVVGDFVLIDAATTGSNDGKFKVLQIDRSGLFDIVVYNEFGAAQVGVAGTLSSTKMIVDLQSDPAPLYVVDISRLELVNCVDPFDNGYFDVLEINRGGGANKNVVIENALGSEQPSPAGRVAFESRSLFTTLPSLELASDSYDSDNRDLQFVNNGVLGPEATVLADTLIAMDILESPTGAPSTLVVQLI